MSRRPHLPMMRWTIRAKLAALVLAVLLPLVAASAYKFWRELAQGRADAQRQVLAAAEAVARHVDEVLSGQIENLEALASVRSPERIRDEDLQALAARVRVRHPFIRGYVAAASDGRVTASSHAPLADAAIDAATVAAALDQRAPRIGAPRPSTLGDFIVPVVVPVLASHGMPGAVVAAEVDLIGLSAFLDGLGFGNGTSVALVTADGVIVARSAAGRALGQRLAGAAAPRALIIAGTGVAEWRGEDGTVSLAGAAPMTRAPWVAIAAVPSDQAYGAAALRLRADLAGLGMVMLAALSLAWLISHRMTRSIQAMLKGVQRLAGEAASAKMTDPGDELAQLGEQFSQAIAARQRAEAAIEARQRRIQALAEVNLSLSRQLDRERLLQQITEAVVQLTGARTVVLWEADEPNQMLIRRAWSAHESIPSVELPGELSFDQGGTGWVARYRQPLFVDDIARDDRIMAVDWALRHDLVAFAGVPVVAGERLLGVLTLNLARGTLPEGDERALLSSFASQAAVAIRNAQLFAETDARRRAAELLSDLGRTLAQALDPGLVAQQIADSVRALLRAEGSALYRLEPETGDLVTIAVSGIAGGVFDLSIRLPSGKGMVGLAARDRRAVATQNVLTDPRIALPLDVRATVERTSYRAILAIPLVVKDAVIGALAAGDREGRRFDEEETRSAQAFADQAALALDNARLYEETYLRLRHLDSLREVVEQILVPVSLEERLTVIARKAAELFEADRAIIALWDDRHQLVVRAGHGLNAGEQGRVLRPGSGVTSIAASRGDGVLVNDYENWPHGDPYIVAMYRSRPAHAVIGYPLLIRDQVIGAISVGLHAPGRPFVEADLGRLASFAVPAALAIEHSRLYEELASRLRELQDTQAQLVQAGKLSAVGQLVSGVAHELNNPLSVVIGYGQLLKSRELPPEIRRPVELIVAQGDRMAKIVQSLLLFSRQRRPERGAVDVHEAFEQTVGLRAMQLMLAGIRLERTYGEDVPAVEGDVHQLQQVFLNLLLNAEQAILGSGAGKDRIGDCIHVSTTACVDSGEPWVIMRFMDNGPGIAAGVLPRIFEPFFTTKKVGEGTGLGLSVSYGIVQQHGGRLRVESCPGATVFTLELPAMRRAAPPAGAPANAPAAPAGKGRLALVVDDEESVLELVTLLLREAGWTVEVATGGHAALECLRHRPYDLVVSDVRMPDGDGPTLYRAATAERHDLADRFLFITGDTANAEAWEFLQQSRVHVVEKPFTTEALLTAIERVTA